MEIHKDEKSMDLIEHKRLDVKTWATIVKTGNFIIKVFADKPIKFDDIDLIVMDNENDALKEFIRQVQDPI